MPVIAIDNDDTGIDKERRARGEENRVDAELWVTLGVNNIH